MRSHVLRTWDFPVLTLGPSVLYAQCDVVSVCTAKAVRKEIQSAWKARRFWELVPRQKCRLQTTADLLVLWQFSFIEKISIKNWFKSFSSLRYLEKKRVLLDKPFSAVSQCPNCPSSQTVCCWTVCICLIMFLLFTFSKAVLNGCESVLNEMKTIIML